MSGDGVRIWRTADGRYVGDGHLDAEVLVAGPTDPRPDDFDPDLFEAGPAPVVEGAEPSEPSEPSEPEPAKGKAKK